MRYRGQVSALRAPAVCPGSRKTGLFRKVAPTGKDESFIYLTSVTGTRERCTTFVETEPSTAPRNGLKPRVPITI